MQVTSCRVGSSLTTSSNIWQAGIGTRVSECAAYLERYNALLTLSFKPGFHHRFFTMPTGPLNVVTVDLIFHKCKPIGGRRFHFPHYLKALAAIAQDSGHNVFELIGLLGIQIKPHALVFEKPLVSKVWVMWCFAYLGCCTQIQSRSVCQGRLPLGFLVGPGYAQGVGTHCQSSPSFAPGPMRSCNMSGSTSG